MLNRLRHLTVFVDEPEPGHFHWVLIESTENASAWNDIESSQESFDMWLDAWVEGGKALLKHVEDERIGPRAPGEDEDASPVG